VRLQGVVDLLPAAPWILPFFTLPRLARRSPSLNDAPAAAGPMVSIIVPARNESTNILQLLESLLGTEYEPFELIVVDDRSTDDTAALVRRVNDPRLRLLSGEALPDGWYGKPWACYQGYQQATGELLLFTDADTRHQPGLLSRAVGEMERVDAALVTVSPRQLCLTFWERVIMPQIWFLLSLRYHPDTVSRARRPRDVIANGQFILTTRLGYESAGTHAAVHDEVAEDLALAQVYVRKGLKLHFAFAERLMETRMYRGLSHLIEGWSKNIYLGGRRSFPDEPLRRALVPAMLVVAMLFWLIPAGVVLGSGLDLNLELWRAPALLAGVLAAVFWMLICYGMEIPALYGLAYPVGALMSLYIILRPTWRGRRQVEWKGRTYRRSTTTS
jgi:chlorobactene glucosyltransferase